MAASCLSAIMKVQIYTEFN